MDGIRLIRLETLSRYLWMSPHLLAPRGFG